MTRYRNIGLLSSLMVTVILQLMGMHSQRRYKEVSLLPEVVVMKNEAVEPQDWWGWEYPISDTRTGPPRKSPDLTHPSLRPTTLLLIDEPRERHRFSPLKMRNATSAMAMTPIRAFAPAATGSSNGSSSAPQQGRSQRTRPALPLPVFVLSLPKSGTTSTEKYFNCGWPSSASHKYAKLPNGTVIEAGVCMEANVQMGRPLVAGCGQFQVWTDSGYIAMGKLACFYPSIHGGLDNIASHYPNATIMLVVRQFEDWYQSAMKWGTAPLLRRWTNRCQGFPKVDSRNSSESAHRLAWRQFYMGHTRSIRRFARRHPSLTYLEASLESNQTGKYLQSRTGIKASCWGKYKPRTLNRTVPVGRRRRVMVSAANQTSPL